MEKEIFTMGCTVEPNKHSLDINFSIEGNGTAAAVFGQENYDKYLQDVIEVLKTVTDEINELTIKLIVSEIKKTNKDAVKDILKNILKELEGE